MTVDDTNVNNASFMLGRSDTTESVVNSIYRYKFKHIKLVNPKLLLHVPFYRNANIQQIGGVVIIDHINNKKSIKSCNRMTLKHSSSSQLNHV